MKNAPVRGMAGVVLLAAALTVVNAAPIAPALYSGLAWRNIGPFRAGRVSAVSGAVGQPGVFYAGMPLGGVFKTTSAGETWYPIFDSVTDVSCVGAIQVAPSNPDVVYVGTGDLITGGGINEGNGVYKSTDAGATWQHLGLDDTRQIPAILVDPHDPNLVLVAAQGNIHTHTDQRGVFRTVDGGKTWAKTLYVDNETGVQSIAWAFDRPDVVLATTVRHYTAPGATGRGGAGAPGASGAGAAASGPVGTALYKSTDQGVTWHPVTGGGLPAMVGRTSVAVAMGTNAQRMYLIGGFGLYRSDDGGTSWKQMAAGDRRIAGSGYLCGVYVDPKNPDLVYTMNTTSYRSTDGGNTFAAFKGAPGGDDPQQMWIDPTNGQRMFLGVDQGATISLDGGRTWSSWYNQPTAQIYHVSTDNRYPYWVYGSEQDSGTIATRSRGNLGAITTVDWYPTPGYEFGSPVPDPLNPDIVYAGGPASGIVKITMPSGQWINVSPNVDASLGLRKVTNQPMLWLPQNARELLVGFQFVMATTDGGMHWKKISPDLGYPNGQAPPAASPTAPAAVRPGAPAPAAAPTPAPAAGAGGRGGAPTTPPGGSIESMSASTVAAGTIWAGTSNGLIHVTRNHGATWKDVTIPNLPNAPRADISAIDSSHHDPGTAYVAVDCHGVGDYKPYFYRTRDYGKTWTLIVNGLPTDRPSGSFARVIRADTVRAGLLFAGTESSVYVSFNDGDDWQPLTLNLPNTSCRDLAIHGVDLVLGTYGRGFWILDDITPLRELTPATAGETVHLFKPAEAIRVRRNVNGDTPFPPEVPHAPNPPLGAVIYYYLAARPAGPITLEVVDAHGRVVRHLSSAPIPPLPDPPPPVPDYWLEKPKPMPAEAATNRVNWNIRYDDPPAFTHNYAQVMGAMPGDTPASPEGPLAPPGAYTVRLTVDGKTVQQPLTVKNDPRSPASAADIQAQHELQMKLYDGARAAWDGYGQVAAVRSAVGAIVRSKAAAAVTEAATAFDARLAAIGGTAGGGRGGRGGFGGPAPAPTFVSVNAALLRQLDTLDFGDMAPNEPMRGAFAAGCKDLHAVIASWLALTRSELAAFNAVLAKNGVQAIAPPGAALSTPACQASPAAPAARKPAAKGGRGGPAPAPR
jgi:photosystem II stability/assembly factor-like uncharacterized protein